MRECLSWMLVLGLLTVGCDGDGGDDAGPGDGGGMDVDSGPEVDAGPGGMGDGNDSFAEADPLVLGEANGARINPAGDLDYYSFEGTEGDWMAIFTEADMTVDPYLDTVITLYDGSMNQIAENDDRLPRADTDSEILIRLPATGTYYVLVQEFSSWDGNPDPMATPEGGLDFTYELTVTTLDPMLSQVNIDEEPGDDVATAPQMGRNGTFGLFAGTWDDASDVDVWSFVMARNPNPNFYVMPIGPDGYGASSMPATMWVTSDDGSEIIAQITPTGDGLFAFDPSLPSPGTFNVHIESGEAGGWYVVKSFIGGDNPPEMEEATNGDPSTPEMLDFQPDEQDMNTDEAFVLADLPMGDTDYYAIATTAGDVVNVSCGSRTSGSGILDLMVEVTSADGMTVHGMATETETDNAFIENLSLPAAGDYRVRLTRGAQRMVGGQPVTGDWVRCGMRVGPMPSM